MAHDLITIKGAAQSGTLSALAAILPADGPPDQHATADVFVRYRTEIAERTGVTKACADFALSKKHCATHRYGRQ